MEPGTFWTALVWGAVPMLLVLAGIWWIDRYEKEPLRLLFVSLVFGALIAPVIAYAIEKGLDISTSFTAQNWVPKFQLGPGLPLVEELVRGGAILLVFLLVRFEIDDMLDGIIYGGVIGAGFGAAANFVSIWSTPTIKGGGSASLSLYTTAITQFNHVFYGAIIGLACAAVRRRPVPQIAGAALVGSAVAFGLHILHDYMPWWVATSPGAPSSSVGSRIVTQAPNYAGVFILGLIALWAVGREKVIVGRELESEVQTGVVTSTDYANLTNSFRRSFTLWSALLRRGERAWRLRRRLYGQEIELAFRKYHRREETSAESREFASEDEYRERIRNLRTKLSEVDPIYADEGTARAPRPPSNAFVAGIGGLTVFGVLVAAGILLWILALRPHAEDLNATPASALGAYQLASGGIGYSDSSAGFAAVGGSDSSPNVSGGVDTSGFTAGGNESIGSLAVLKSAAPNTTAAGASLVVAACRQATPQECRGSFRPGSTIPRSTSRVDIAVVWSGLKRGTALGIYFFNADTRQLIFNPVRGSISGNGYYFRHLRGPFPRFTLFVVVTVNGSAVNFKPPPVWRVG